MLASAVTIFLKFRKCHFDKNAASKSAASVKIRGIEKMEAAARASN